MELQQFAVIERTMRSFEELSPGKVDLAMSLLTSQQTQRRSTESLIVFLANKAAELRRSKELGLAALGLEVFAPLANLLGLGRIKDEIEDSAFALTHPMERQELRELLGGGEALVNEAVDELRKALETGPAMEGRAKHSPT